MSILGVRNARPLRMGAVTSVWPSYGDDDGGDGASDDGGGGDDADGDDGGDDDGDDDDASAPRWRRSPEQG